LNSALPEKQPTAIENQLTLTSMLDLNQSKNTGFTEIAFSPHSCKMIQHRQPGLPMPSATAIKHKKISIADVMLQAEKASKMVNDVKGTLLAPTNIKTAPVFSLTQLAALCGIDKGQVSYRMTKDDLPPGQMNATGSRREFTLSQAREWVKAFRAPELKPKNKQAVVIVICNFKGGVSKTTTSMTLAQSLSLRGHRVLAVDCDPQGSLTTLFGISPDTDVVEDQTIAPVVSGEETSLTSAIRATYWDGLDLVASAPFLFSAELILPVRQMREPSFKFYDVLNLALEEAREEYDVIIIDTAPALSYITINAIAAADGLIVPMPPNALDFASSSQFWTLFSDFFSNLVNTSSFDKSFDFINILLSKVDSQDAISSEVRKWIAATYTDKLLPVEIPKTAVTSSSSAEFGTVYDISKYDGNAKTLKRARDAYDRVADLIEQSIQSCWAGQE
jgi:chromosome partitioning protein